VIIFGYHNNKKQKPNMDIEQSPSGKIIKSSTGYKAYIPDLLPPKFEWNKGIL
jgi:hypothetical protein